MVFVSADQRGREHGIHQPPRVQQALNRHGWGAGRQVSYPLIVDFIGPARFDQAVDGQLNEDVPEMKRVKDAGVKDRDGGLKRHSAAEDPPRPPPASLQPPAGHRASPSAPASPSASSADAFQHTGMQDRRYPSD